MGLHKQMIGKIGPGSAPKDVYLRDYIARKQDKPQITLAVRQNGNGWSLNFDTNAPDTLEEAIKLAKKLLENK